MPRLELSLPSRVTGAGIGLLSTLAAGGLAYLLRHRFGLPVTFLPFVPAVLVAAWFGGRGGGYLSVCLSVFAVIYVLPPVGWRLPLDVANWAALLVFVVMGGLLVGLTAKVRASLALRDTLMSIAGHDLKQPLATIALEAGMLARLSERPTTSIQKVGPHAERISRQVEHLNLMILNLLDVVRVRSARLLRLEEADLSEIARNVIERSSSLLASRGCELSLEGGDRPILGVWDRSALDQILANLIGNAIKYGAGKPIIVTLAASSDKASFTVRDHGRGMSPEDRRHCFEPFRRGSAKHAAKGHGLGLWIVKMLVEAHHGRIRVDPAVDNGTAFDVELPRAARNPRLTNWLESFRASFSSSS